MREQEEAGTFVFNILPGLKEFYSFNKVKANAYILFKPHEFYRDETIVKEQDWNEKPKSVDVNMFRVQQKRTLNLTKQDRKYLYIIKSGQCKIVKKVMRKNQFDRLEYKKEFIMLIGQGEIFGEEALVDFTQNFSVVVQSQQCTVLRIDHSEFL